MSVLDDGSTIPFSDKTDKNPLKPTDDPKKAWAAADSAIVNVWLTALRQWFTGAIANALRLFHNPSEPVGSSNQAIIRSNGGQAQISEGGGPYVWIKSLDKVNLGDKRFALNGGGTVDDAAALTAGILATVAASTSTKKGCLILPSDVQIKIASAVTVPAALGFNMEGTGMDSSQIVVDPTTPNANGLVINSSERARLEGFSLLGKSSNPAGSMILFDYNPLVNNSNQHRISDVMISLASGSRLAYQYGINFSNAHGENSEVQYDNLLIEGFAEAGINLPGTQQYGHVMRNVQINGRWDGVDPSANGGKFGVKADGGSFQFRDGGVGACRAAAFVVLQETAPCIIDGVDMELNYQLFGSGSPSSAMTGSGSVQEIEIANCRFESPGVAFDSTGIIQGNVGSFNIHNNIFFGGDGSLGQMLIAFAPAQFPHGHRVVDNQFLTVGSKDVDPVVIYGTALQMRQCIEVKGNIFVNDAGQIDYRDETLSRASIAGTFYGGALGSLGVQQDMYAVDLTTFIAASPTQTIAMPMTQPRMFTYHEFRAFLYNYAIVTGGATLTMRIGTTSGGDELLQDIAIGGSGVGDGGAWYGDPPTERGTMLQGGAHMPDGINTTQVYVTVTASSGNLGNGSVSNITRGLIHVPVKYSIQPRFIA